MQKSLVGPVVVGVIAVGIGAFLFLNLETPKPAPVASSGGSASPGVVESTTDPAATQGATAPAPGAGAPIREYPIGDEVEKNHIRIAAVWLPGVSMSDMASEPGMTMIHIEADIKALENNPNGFAKDEKVDYLTVGYKLVPASGGEPIIAGNLLPMMARDGFHYGATIAMPAPGQYKLLYDLSAPSMGRHSDPATGVAPWWEPFQVAFDWTVEPEAATVSQR